MFGSTLILLGVLLLGYSAGMYWGVLPGGRVSVPRPPALDRPRPAPPVVVDEPRPIQEPAPAPTVIAPPSLPASTSAAVPIQVGLPDNPSTAAPAGESVAPPVTESQPAADPDPAAAPGHAADSEMEMIAPDPAIYAIPLRPADADDRPYWGNRPPPSQAVHLAIPAIKLDTKVVAGGIVINKDGEPEWETVPFVAAHYVQTSLVGARGNAVISGHVVTLREGNVFRDLYRVDFGNKIYVDTVEGQFVYAVEDIKLVSPSDVDVMAPTREPTLTLVTCGGEFDQRTRQFSHRLIIVGRLVDWGRHTES